MSEAILQAGTAVAQPDVFVTYHAVSNSLSVFFDYTDVGGQANYTFTGAFASTPGNTIQGFSQTEFDARFWHPLLAAYHRTLADRAARAETP